jgi:hypothetical protein
MTSTDLSLRERDLLYAPPELCAGKTGIVEPTGKRPQTAERPAAKAISPTASQPLLARVCKRRATGRGEGRKPYGTRPGEAEVVALIHKLTERWRAAGRRRAQRSAVMAKHGMGFFLLDLSIPQRYLLGRCRYDCRWMMTHCGAG